MECISWMGELMSGGFRTMGIDRTETRGNEQTGKLLFTFIFSIFLVT